MLQDFIVFSYVDPSLWPQPPSKWDNTRFGLMQVWTKMFSQDHLPTQNEITPDLDSYKFRPKMFFSWLPTHPKWQNTRYWLDTSLDQFLFSQDHQPILKWCNTQIWLDEIQTKLFFWDHPPKMRWHQIWLDTKSDLMIPSRTKSSFTTQCKSVFLFQDLGILRDFVQDFFTGFR